MIHGIYSGWRVQWLRLVSLNYFSMDGAKRCDCLASSGLRVMKFAFAGLLKGVLLEPVIADPAAWFAEMDRVRKGYFLYKERNQPVTPRREIFK